MLCSDKFGFTLLPCLVIDLKSVIKVAYKSRAAFLTANCRIFLIAGPVFSTAFWTLAAYVPFLRRMHGPQGRCILLFRSYHTRISSRTRMGHPIRVRDDFAIPYVYTRMVVLYAYVGRLRRYSTRDRPDRKVAAA